MNVIEGRFDRRAAGLLEQSVPIEPYAAVQCAAMEAA